MNDKTLKKLTESLDRPLAYWINPKTANCFVTRPAGPIPGPWNWFTNTGERVSLYSVNMMPARKGSAEYIIVDYRWFVPSNQELTREEEIEAVKQLDLTPVGK